MNKKVSLIGSNGFISTALARYFSSSGYKVNVIGRHEPKHIHWSEYHSLDLLKEKIPFEMLEDSGIVIYCAGAGIQANRNDSPAEIFNLNAFYPILLSQVLISNKYDGVFITFGSVFEMGSTYNRDLFTEQDIISANSKTANNYILSKRLLTKYISSQEEPISHLHFILPSIYGPGEAEHRLIAYVLGCIKNDESPCLTSGSQMRQFVHVSDIGPIIQHSIVNKIKSGIYNIGNNEIYSVKEIVYAIYKAVSASVPENIFGELQRADTGMVYLALSNDKLQNLVGNYEFKTLSQGISTYLPTPLSSRIRIIPRKKLSDQRGWFLKAMTGSEQDLPKNFGEIYLTMAKTGECKGGHYHPKALEWFTLIEGQATLDLVDIFSAEKYSIFLDSESPSTVFIPNNVAHIIKNVSSKDATLLAYTDLAYDPKDTIKWDF